MSNRAYKQFKKKTGNLIFMQNLTIQSYSERVFRIVKYCASKDFAQQTLNSRAM